MSSFTNSLNNKKTTSTVDDMTIVKGDIVRVIEAPEDLNILGKEGVVTEIIENFRDGFRNYIISSDESSNLNGEYSLAWDVRIEKIEGKEDNNSSIDVLGVGLDTSGSMAGILETVVDEGKGVIDALNPEKIVFCEFSSHFECYSLNKEKAKERMDQVKAQGGTAMYDGVTTMLKEIINISLQGKKVMVLIITDGMENSSTIFTKKDLEESKTKLRELVGEDCIREICIGNNLEEANRLMKLTPGLKRESSVPVTRDIKSISSVIRSISNPTPKSNSILEEVKKEDVYTDTIMPPKLQRL